MAITDEVEITEQDFLKVKSAPDAVLSPNIFPQSRASRIFIALLLLG